jgi:hypothetical protein
MTADGVWSFSFCYPLLVTPQNKCGSKVVKKMEWVLQHFAWCKSECGSLSVKMVDDSGTVVDDSETVVHSVAGQVVVAEREVRNFTQPAWG